jgi:hypothetical protein
MVDFVVANVLGADARHVRRAEQAHRPPICVTSTSSTAVTPSGAGDVWRTSRACTAARRRPPSPRRRG